MQFFVRNCVVEYADEGNGTNFILKVNGQQQQASFSSSFYECPVSKHCTSMKKNNNFAISQYYYIRLEEFGAKSNPKHTGIVSNDKLKGYQITMIGYFQKVKLRSNS